jgi:8-oxo-dGTP diphosphatase
VASAKFIVVVSLVIEHEGAVLLARRHPESEHAPGAWDVISGRVEAGESPHEAAQREGWEETGLHIDVGAPIDTFHFLRGPDRDEAIGITFRCRAHDRKAKLSKEHTEFAWVTLEQARKHALPKGLLRCIGLALEPED